MFGASTIFKENVMTDELLFPDSSFPEDIVVLIGCVLVIVLIRKVIRSTVRRLRRIWGKRRRRTID